MAELWDDSALITAFNSAIAKYKTMHGVAGKSKKQDHEVTEDFASMESESHVVENLNEYEVENMELLQKEGSGHESSQQESEMPPLSTDKRSSHEEAHVGKNSLEEAPATSGYNGYAGYEHCTHAGSEYYTQQGYPTTSENCYLCQWNAYYSQTGAWTLPASSGSNGLQCQYCGFVNQCVESTKNHQETSSVPQTLPDASAFPEIVRAAVAEAVKATEGQKRLGDMMESSHTRTGFSDVAVAWFLAGFHTSRYLSQGRDSK